MNIACWSGPRNLSTAMMYAFAARGDCAVWDEPFYAAYLHDTGLDHPMRDAIIASGETDASLVARDCAAPDRHGRRHFYQKHMTHHMVDGFDRGWFDAAIHVFLIRHPARVLASYNRKRENPTLDDIGIVQQEQIFDEVRARGLRCVVVDSNDIRKAPEAMLGALCAAIGLDFLPAMLSWPQGGHPDDGVWATHWYGAIHRSTGFAGAEGPLPALDAKMIPVCDAAMPHYARLASHAIPCPSEQSK